MNRHKTYWSTMGNEPQEKTSKQEDIEKFTKHLKIMFGKYDKQEVLTLVRNIFLESED